MAISKRKKVKKVFSRRARTGIEEAPTDSFFHFNSYIRTEVDKKEVASKIKEYLKQTLPKKDYQIAMKAPEWHFTSLAFIAAALSWKEKGFELPEAKWEETIDRNVKNIVEAGRIKSEEKDEESSIQIVKKSPAEIIKERTSDFIGEIETIIDKWGGQGSKAISDWSLYDKLRIINAPYNMAKSIVDYYTPIMEEADELVNKKTPDLVEAYSHMPVRRRKEYLKLLSDIVGDAEQYLQKKKAQRKVRKPRVKSADKQVTQVKYLKESSEHKLVSIDPSQIVGARRVYMFNTKQRMLIELVCRLPNGFEVKGTTIQGIDEEVSRQVRLRKPEEFLPVIQKKTPIQINKEWGSLTTKSGKTTGRINKDMIIIRALDK